MFSQPFGKLVFAICSKQIDVKKVCIVRKRVYLWVG